MSSFFSAKAIWALRERLAEALMHDGYCYKYDVSLPLSSFYQLVLDMRQQVSGSAKRVIGYGHVGDGEHEGEFGGGYVVVLFLDSDTVIQGYKKERYFISTEHNMLVLLLVCFVWFGGSGG